MSIKAKVIELDAYEKICMKDSFQKPLSATKKISIKKNINNTKHKSKVQPKSIGISHHEMKLQMMKRASCIVSNYHNDIFLKTGIWKNENYNIWKNENYDMSYIKKIAPEDNYNITYLGCVDSDDVKDNYDVSYVGNIDVNEEDNYDITYVGFVCNVDKISQ